MVGIGVKVWGEINVLVGVGIGVPVGVEIEGWIGVQCRIGVQSGVMAVNSFINPDVDVTFSIPC